MPSALKIFLLSLLAFGAGGYVAFRVALFIALKLISGEYREPLAVAVAALAALLIGTASAVTAGVLAGRNKQS